MSFFKGFKDDLSQAVNELMPDSNEMFDDDGINELLGEKNEKKSKDKKKRKEESTGRDKRGIKSRRSLKGISSGAEDDLDIAPEDMIDQIDDLLEDELYSETEGAQMLLDDDMEVNTMDMPVGDLLSQLSGQNEAEKKSRKKDKQKKVSPDRTENLTEESSKANVNLQDTVQNNDIGLDALLDSIAERVEQENPNTVKDVLEEEDSAKESKEGASLTGEANLEETLAGNEENIDNMEETAVDEEKDMMAFDSAEENVAEASVNEDLSYREAKDSSTTHISRETNIKGDIQTEGSVEIMGNVEGQVICRGKLVVGGSVIGNVEAGELYVNSAKIQGDILSNGSVKIGVGSMIIGGIVGESAVIAGAVNGDIDVQGPVIVDSTAVIMGNIKSRSVQINNGAVIEGFCSQSYSDIDVKNFFA